MNPKLRLSIIMPIYNGEKFLKRAVDSVLCQMDEGIELILVNDGSTDSSGVICDNYAKTNMNVYVYHQCNAGTCAAKNKGIQLARGEYLTFLDCDDYINSDACEKIIHILENEHPDCLNFGFNYIDSSGVANYSHHKIKKNILLKKKDIVERILPPLLNLCKDDDHFIYDFVWNKVFRTKIIKDNDLLFDESRRRWEDRPFLVTYLKYCDTFYAMEEAFYNYVLTIGSLSSRPHLDDFELILKNFLLYEELFGQQYEFYTDYANQYWANAVWKKLVSFGNLLNNIGEMEQTLFAFFKHPQVVYWFENRKCRNSIEKQVSLHVVSGNIRAILKTAYKLWKKDEKQQRTKKVISIIRSKAKLVIKRISNIEKGM